MADPAQTREECDACGKPSDTLYEVEGYPGRYLFCPECFGEDDEDDSQEIAGSDA